MTDPKVSLITPKTRLQQALEFIDSANHRDPRNIPLNGVPLPQEWLYSQRMTQWLHKVEPEPSEALQIAARGQHIKRWQIKRDLYPQTRAGYLAWRTKLYEFHATEIKHILRKVGYDDALISQVQSLLKKKKLKSDHESQILEDVACLVFLEYYISDFAQKHSFEKMVGIVKKTWKKMSENGQKIALSLKLDEHISSVIGRALG